jgi:hypothetical protein
VGGDSGTADIEVYDLRFTIYEFVDTRQRSPFVAPSSVEAVPKPPPMVTTGNGADAAAITEKPEPVNLRGW